MRTSLCIALLFLSLYSTNFLPAAEADKVKAEDILPDTTLMALSVGDLAATRAAFKKTQLADMYSQPEMQQFLAPALEQLRKTYADLKTKNPLLPALVDLDRGILNGELTVGAFPRITADAQGPDGPPVGVIAVLRPEKFESLGRLLEPALGGELPAEGKPFFFGDENSPNTPAIAQLNGRFIFAVPGTEVAKVVERIKAPGAKGTLASAEAFATARAQLKYSAGYAYLNAAALLETITLTQRHDPDFAKVKLAGRALGINTLNAVLLSFGIANDELVMEGALQVAPGQKATGLVSLFLAPNAPISKEGMHLAAVDAPYVSASQVEWGAYLAKLRDVLNAVGIGRQFDGVLMMLDLRLGFSLERDLLASLGTETVLARTAIDTTPPLAFGSVGLVLSIKLKDAAKVENCLQRLQKSFAGQGGGNPIAQMVQVRKTEYLGKSIYYWKELVNSTWSFTVTGDRLIVGTSVNAVKRGLEQLNAKDDILSAPNFQQTIARLTGQPFDPAKLPACFAFQTDESAGGSSLLLTMLGIGTSTGVMAGIAEQIEPHAEEELNFTNTNDPLAEIEKFLKRPSGQVVANVAKSVDLGMWPDEGFFTKYRRPRGALWVSDPMSMYFRTELPFPNFTSTSGSGPLLTVAAVGVIAGLTLPVLGRAREAARRASSANNMSQIGKALILYADVPAHNNEYPADPLDLYPDYIGDARVFLDPRFKNEDAPYVYVTGSTPDDATNIVIYEIEGQKGAKAGRNVLRASGTVEWLDEAAFKRELEQTELALKAKGVEMKSVPISHSAALKKAKK